MNPASDRLPRARTHPTAHQTSGRTSGATCTYGAADSPVHPAEQLDQSARIDRLSAEVAGLRRAMETRPVIDQARGMVMAMGPYSADTAWRVLVEVSQYSNVKLREVAAALTATPEGGTLPRPIERALGRALRRRRRQR